MQHVEDIKAAFKSDTFQTWIKSAITHVPELKHEGIVCTALAAALNQKKKVARREHRQSSSKGHRRFDIFLDGTTSLEAKYHLDFDIASIQKAQLKLTELRRKFAVLNKYGSWSAGEAVLFELARLDSSYFLWSVCCRGLAPPDGTCMRGASINWINRLNGEDALNPNMYVRNEIQKFITWTSENFRGIEGITLETVAAEGTMLLSTLFVRRENSDA